MSAPCDFGRGKGGVYYGMGAGRARFRGRGASEQVETEGGGMLWSWFNGLGRRLRRRRLTELTLALLAACLLVVACLAVWDARVEPLHERTAGALTLAAVALAALAGLAVAVRVWHRDRTDALVRWLDRRFPEFGNGLDSAREVLQRGAPNAVEALLVSHMERAVADRDADLTRAVLRCVPLWRAAVLALVVCVCVAVVAVLPRAVAKAQFWLRGDADGLVLTVSQPDGLFVRGSDVALTADVRRWERDRAVIELQLDGQANVETYDLHPVADAEGAFSFTLFDVQRGGRLRVTTPSLDSGWRRFAVYERPQVSEVRLTLTPPSYTGETERELESLEPFGAVAGTRMRLSLRLTDGASPSLVLNGERTPLRPAGEANRWQMERTLTVSGPLVLEARDAAGRTCVVAELEVSVTPDLPPMIERREPSGDARVEEGSGLRLSAVATDDYGLTSFRFEYHRLSGQEHGRELLTDGRQVREAEWSDEWKVSEAGLEVGDVVTCRFVATDCREPNRQSSRSEVFFVTVMPRRPDQDKAADGQQQQQEERVDVNDLVLESKRLLRQTWELLDYDEPPSREVHETAAALGDLRIEVQRREQVFREKGKVPQLPEPLRTLFATAVAALERAEPLMTPASMRQSLQQQELALAALVKLESELLKNQQQSQSASSKQQQNQEQQGQGQQDGEQQQGEGDESDEQLLATLTKALEKLRAVERSQTALGRRLERGDERSALERAQQGLRRDAGEVAQTLVRHEQADGARQLVEQARQEMGGVLAGLRNGESQVSVIRSARAVERLQAACAALDALLRQIGAQQVEALAKQAHALAQRQQQAAGQSRDLETQKQRGQNVQDARQQAQQQQSQLAADTEKLRQRLQKRAETLRAMWPDTAAALDDTANAFLTHDIAGHQRKAGNALLYRRFERAADEQSQASQSLSQVASDLSRTAATMPTFSLEELKQHIRELQQATQEMEQAQNAADTNAATSEQGADAASSRESSSSQRRLESARRQAGETTSRLGEMLHDARLQQLGGELSAERGEGDAEHPGQASLDEARQALRLAVEHLQRLERQHPGALLKAGRLIPPERYRRSVEEYFRRLAK